MYLVKCICIGNTFCSYFAQDIKQVLLKVEQAWSTGLVSFFGLTWIKKKKTKPKQNQNKKNNKLRISISESKFHAKFLCVNDA